MRYKAAILLLLVSLLLVASNGGSQHNPLWYLNLLEEPKVEVQVGTDIFSALARPATEEEKPSLWQMMVKIFPQYEGYQVCF